MCLPRYAKKEEADTAVFETVFVRGLQPSSLPTRLPTTTEGITGEEIRERINATDAEDALKYLPSLLVRKRYIGDYDHAVLATRASGTGNSARSLVYADGILLSNLLGNGATFTPRWGLVNPEEIERVDVLYGPFAAAYSGNSVGAVVDFVTRMPQQLEAHAKLGYSLESFDLYRTQGDFAATTASASIGDRWGGLSAWLSVNRLDSDAHPVSFATLPFSAGNAGSGTPVTGRDRRPQSAQPGLVPDRRHRPDQYRTGPGQAQARLRPDRTPAPELPAGVLGQRHVPRCRVLSGDGRGRAGVQRQRLIEGRHFSIAPTAISLATGAPWPPHAGAVPARLRQPPSRLLGVLQPLRLRPRPGALTDGRAAAGP